MQRALSYLALAVATAVLTVFFLHYRELSQRVSRLERQEARGPRVDVSGDLTTSVRRIPRRVSALSITNSETSHDPHDPALPLAEPVSEPPPIERPPVIALPGPTVVASEPPIATEAAAVMPIVVPEPDWIRYHAREGGQCVASGTMDGQSWQAISKIIAGQVLLAPPLDFEQREAIAAYPTNLPCTATAVIPVRSFKSGDAAFDAALQTSLAMADFPNLRYQLRELSALEGNDGDTNRMQFRCQGDITLHGVTRSLDLAVFVQPGDDGRLTVSGSGALKLSDFGVVVPAAIGRRPLRRFADNVSIRFEWLLQRNTNRN